MKHSYNKLSEFYLRAPAMSCHIHGGHMQVRRYIVILVPEYKLPCTQPGCTRGFHQPPELHTLNFKYSFHWKLFENEQISLLQIFQALSTFQTANKTNKHEYLMSILCTVNYYLLLFSRK